MTLLSTPRPDGHLDADLRRETIVAALGWEENSAFAYEVAKACRDAAAYHHERGNHAAGSRESADARAAEKRALRYRNEARRLRASIGREA